jgi:cation:H+ antiporter
LAGRSSAASRSAPRRAIVQTKGRAVVTLAWLTLQLIASTAIILFAAKSLTRSAVVIAEKTGLGRSFVGVLMLATATSLPEMGTGVSSVLLDEPDIAMGAAFGSNLFNLVIICFLDWSWRRGALLSAVGPTSALVARLGILVIAMGSLAVLAGRRDLFGSSWSVSPMSMLMVAAFVLAMRSIYRADRVPATPTTKPSSGSTDEMSLTHAGWSYAIAAVFVIAGSYWLAHTGDGFVNKVGLEASFVGTQFLAMCTSLPEVATSFAALRMKAPDLALANVLGSNLFNMGFVTVLNDAAFTRGSIWSEVSSVHAVTGTFGVLMTILVLIGLRRRARARRVGMFESVGLLLLYLAASVFVYRAG